VDNTPLPGIVGELGEQHVNSNGQELRQFANTDHLKIRNTFYRKRDIQKYTWSARGYRSIIDYILVNDKLRPQAKDTRVHRGIDISSYHYLLISEIALWAKLRSIEPRQTRTQEEVYKVYLLQEESIRILYQWRLR
jgi:hypothetical protein